MAKGDSLFETIVRWGARRRSRIEADSRVSFGKFMAKMLLAVSFILLDGVFIPSAFDSAGLLSASFAVPIALVLLIAGAAELKILVSIK